MKLMNKLRAIRLRTDDFRWAAEYGAPLVTMSYLDKRSYCYFALCLFTDPKVLLWCLCVLLERVSGTRELQGAYALNAARLLLILRTPSLFIEQGSIIVTSEQFMASLSQSSSRASFSANIPTTSECSSGCLAVESTASRVRL